MGYFEEIDVRIKGQTKKDNGREIILAKLKVICAEYGLDLEE